MSGTDDDWVGAMRRGDYAQAWAIADRQVAARDPRQCDDPSLPYHLRWVWDGRALDGCDVLVRCYHGLGDTIQFLRFLPLLKARAASVTLEVQPRLVPLLPGAIADRVLAFDPVYPLKPAERDVEIMELSHALRASPEDAPPPYLAWDPATLPAGTIGLCLQAGDWDPARSIPPLLAEPFCQARSCVTLDPAPSPLPVLNPQGCPFDIAATAALVAGCAVVVTVDTMIAHLAGAMGKPAIVLLKHEPDWRWCPRSGRSEWYPSLRLIAQRTPGDWPEAIARAAAQLDRVPSPQQENA